MSEWRRRVGAAAAVLGSAGPARAAAGFADDGFATGALIAIAILLLTVMATGFLTACCASAGGARRNGGRRVHVWAAFPILLIVVFGIVRTAIAGHVVIAAIPFTALATGFVAGRAVAAKRERTAWSRLLAWAAAAFPISGIVGIARFAMNWHLGIAASLADPATHIWGCAQGAFVCAWVLPAMLIVGLLRTVFEWAP